MTEKIIGNAYQELIEIVKMYAGKDTPVLLSGDRGTGKELFAQLYFKESPRKAKKQTINCAAFTETLLESEIFGHEVGAFSGATKKRLGIAKSCDNGILFLDEIGASSQEFQAKILRFVEYKKIRPVGSDNEEDVNCLVIAATNAIGNIREDLKDRFKILPIPPLQKDDIPLLVKHFLNGKTFQLNYMKKIMARDYPGNVRELKNECERLRIEEGEQVLVNGGSDLMIEGASFDYNRYRSEIDTWQTQITPVLKANGIEEFQYKYQPWPVATGKERSDFLTYNVITDGNVVPYECNIPMAELIQFLKKGIHHEEGIPIAIPGEDPIPPNILVARFRNQLRGYVEAGALPLLLQELSMKSYPSPDKPDLYPLLNLPLNNAQKEFTRLYLKYISEMNDGDINEIAKIIGLTPKSTKQKLKRMKI